MKLNVIHSLIEKIIPNLTDGTTIILMSQVPVGFTRSIQKVIHTARPALSFFIIYWVETLVIGDAVSRFF